jgi:hypothetical protein
MLFRLMILPIKVAPPTATILLPIPPILPAITIIALTAVAIIIPIAASIVVASIAIVIVAAVIATAIALPLDGVLFARLVIAEVVVDGNVLPFLRLDASLQHGQLVLEQKSKILVCRTI